MPSSTSSLSDAIGRLYDLDAGTNRWPSALRASIQLLNARSGFVRLIDSRRNKVELFEAIGYDTEFVRQYREHYLRLDPYRKRFKESAPGTLLVTDEIVDRSAHRKTEYFNGYEKPQDLYHAIGGTVAKFNDTTVEIGFQRGRKAGPFSAQALGLTQALMPHFARACSALAYSGHQDISPQLALAALESLAVGVVVVDESSRPLAVNRAAEMSMARSSVRIGSEGFELPSSSDTMHLSALVYSAGQGRCAGPVTYQSAPRLRWLALPISPARVPAGWRPGRTVVVHVFERPDCSSVESELTRRYKLTAAEIVLAEALARGLTVREIAEQRHVSVNTVRSQLRACLQKTDTHRQHHLVAIVERFRRASAES